MDADALVFGEIQTWGYVQSTRVHSRATTGCLRFIRMLVLCTPQHNPAHHAKSCNPVTVRKLTHTRKSYFVAWTLDARMDKVMLPLWPSAKHGAHVVWFSGGTKTRRGSGFLE